MNYKNLIFKSSFLVFLFLISLMFSKTVLADDCVCKTRTLPSSNISIQSSCTACPTSCSSSGYDFVSCTATPAGSTTVVPQAAGSVTAAPQTLPNPLGITDVNAFIAQLINFVLSLVGSVSLLLFVYGGITWMTSAGASAQVKKGKDIVVWAVIGLAVVFTSYILVKFVIQGITGA